MRIRNPRVVPIRIRLHAEAGGLSQLTVPVLLNFSPLLLVVYAATIVDAPIGPCKHLTLKTNDNCGVVSTRVLLKSQSYAESSSDSMIPVLRMVRMQAERSRLTSAAKPRRDCNLLRNARTMRGPYLQPVVNQ